MNLLYTRLYPHGVIYFLCCIFCWSINAQQKIWVITNTANIDDIQYPINPPNRDIKTFRLNEIEFKSKLESNTNKSTNGDPFISNIDFPMINGSFLNFKIEEISALAPKLNLKYPEIKSYRGRSSQQTNTTIRFTMSPYTGLYAVINENGKKSYVVRNKSKKSYSIYKHEEFLKKGSQFKCLIDQVDKNKKVKESSSIGRKNQLTGLHRYQLAMATSIEYTKVILANLGISESHPDAKPAILSWLNEVLLIVNDVFERDLSITFELVADNDQLISLDLGEENDENSGIYHEFRILEVITEKINEKINPSSYDLGHILAKGPKSGIANSHSSCKDFYKGAGLSLAEDLFLEDVLMHEIGHQFGASHSFNNCDNTPPPYNFEELFLSTVEPGSGSTIMAYPGLCTTNNIAPEKDFFFHTVNIEEIDAYINEFCLGNIETNNNFPPFISKELKNYTIPKSTPFILEGKAEDPNNDDQLTYSWSQMDYNFATSPPIKSSAIGPLFRWEKPSVSPSRYFPNLETIKSGELSNKWEVLPSVTRRLRFRLTVRDNSLQGGKTAQEDMEIKVDDTTGPFLIQSQNESETWYSGSTKNIQWDVANTDKGTTDTQNVDILLSVDGGQNFDYELALKTANDGLHDIIVPNGIETSNARIMVKANDNIFFDLNDSDIIIHNSDFIIDAATEEQIKRHCIANSETTHINLIYKTFNNFNETVKINVSDIKDAIVEVSPKEVTNNNTPITITVSGLKNKHLGQIPIEITAQLISDESITTKTKITLKSSITPPEIPSLIQPANKTSSQQIPVEFKWSVAGSGESSVIFQVAENPDFKSIIAEKQQSQPQLILKNLNYNKNYYWRVKSINNCGESSFSETFSFKTQEDDRIFLPDDTFEEYLITRGFDTAFDDHIKPQDAEKVDSIWLRYYNIKSLQGIEAFTQLVILEAGNNSIETIDLSKNKKLRFVGLGENQISEIDLTNNGELEKIFLYSNQITELDLSHNQKLKSIQVSDNHITKLNLSKNNNLEFLAVNFNPLKELDIAKNYMLKILGFSDTQLSSLNLSNNTNLESIHAGDNPYIKSLDLSGLEKLKEVTLIDFFELIQLNLKNNSNDLLSYLDISFNPLLNCVQVDNPALANSNGGVYANWNKDLDLIYGENCFINDFDQDGVINALDAYPNTPENALVDHSGGVIIPSNSFTLIGKSPSCPNMKNGQIEFTNSSSYRFDITATGNNFSKTFYNIEANQGFTIQNLDSGAYTLTFAFSENLGRPIEGYIVNIGESSDVKVSKVDLNLSTKRVKYTVSGSSTYSVYVNNQLKNIQQVDKVGQTTLDIALNPGDNVIRIEGDNVCQRKFEETLFIESDIFIYPNPTKNNFYIEGARGSINIFNSSGIHLINKKAKANMQIDLSNYPPGIYYLIITDDLNEKTIKKILKQN